MVNLEFHFFYIKLIKFQNFVEVFVEYTQFFFFFQRIFKKNFCLLAVVLLNPNPLEFLKYLYPFLSYAKNKFF